MLRKTLYALSVTLLFGACKKGLPTPEFAATALPLLVSPEDLITISSADIASERRSVR